MIESVTQRPQARLDLLEQYVYFGEQANVELAWRDFAALQSKASRTISASTFHARMGST